MKAFNSSFGKIELTDERLTHILEFHPEVKSLQKHFVVTIKNPQLIRPSKSDPQVYIFYRKIGSKKFLVIVIKTGTRNFILTAYITNKLNPTL